MSPSLVSFKRRMQGHVQQGGVFTGSDLRSGQAFQSVWENVTFDDARLSMVDFRGSKWVNCHLVKTAFYGANFNAATLNGVVIDGCDGEQASFVGAVLRNVTFTNCRLAYASFAGATLHDVVFDSCNLHGANLIAAETSGVQYAKSNLWSAEVQLGCSFWNSGFGVADCERFAALLARIHPDPAAKEILVKLAGARTYNAVCRLMESQDGNGPEF
jgi:uncharacterized protein YjbI with pentapeptide repeats